MSAYQRLDMRQGQSLVMTPQLQQAIKLLQLSNIELAEFVAEEIEKNPLLARGENAAPEEYDGDVDKAKGRDELSLDGSDDMGTARDAVDAADSDMYESGTGSDEARTANSQSGPSASTDWSRSVQVVAAGKISTLRARYLARNHCTSICTTSCP